MSGGRAFPGPGLPANHVPAERSAQLCRPLFVTVAIAPFPLVFVLPHLEQVRFDARSGGPRLRNRFQQPVVGGGEGDRILFKLGPPLPPRVTAAFRSNRPLYLPTFPYRQVPLRLIKCYQWYCRIIRWVENRLFCLIFYHLARWI